METIIAWIIISVGLAGGIFGPILTRKKTKLVAWYVVGWVGWFFFATVSSMFVLAFINLIIDEKTLSGTTITTVIDALMYLTMFGFMIWLPWRRWKTGEKGKSLKKGATRKFILKISGLDRRPTLDDVKKFASFFPLYFVTNLAVSIVLALLVSKEIMEQEQNVGFSTTGNTPLSLILIFLCLVVLAPLFEEMLIRGVLFSKLREKLKFWPVALLTASIFALIHGQFNVGVMTFILALYAAFLREKTGAIWSGMMLHMMQNLIAFVVLFLT
ncbi:CPBP family intramembrane metalloprotease [Candidatus Saccharibacteria bacterium]|nr:CPBP family intramembrane metalloprotease [Candidatus Saccharibacteria bacterium]